MYVPSHTPDSLDCEHLPVTTVNASHVDARSCFAFAILAVGGRVSFVDIMF